MQRYRGNYTLFVSLIVWSWIIFVSGCGGGSKTTSTSRDGRVFLRNNITTPVIVSYVNEQTGFVETTVQPGATEEVSKALLKAGTEVTFELAIHTGCDTTVKANFKITGNITIRVTHYVHCAGVLEWELMTS